MFRLSYYVVFIILFFNVFFFPCRGQPCSTYRFSSKTFSFCNDLPVLDSSLHWNFHQSNNMVDVAFRLHHGLSERRWIAWAINPKSTGMIGSQALVAYPTTEGILVTYTSPITSYTTQLQPGNLSFPVFNISATYANNEMVIFATIQLPDNSTTINHLWQEGPLSENTPMMHRTGISSPNVKSFGSLDLLSGRITAPKGGISSTTRLKYAHGVLNTISWGVLMPTGVIIARYLKLFPSADPLWYYLHVGCQVSAYLIGGAAGWGTGLALGRRSSGIGYSAHRYIGIALFCLATLQVIVAAFLRPAKSSKYRCYFNWFHYLVGYSTIILSSINIFKGFHILQATNIWWSIYIGVISLLGFLAVLLELYRLFPSLECLYTMMRRKPSLNTESSKVQEATEEV